MSTLDEHIVQARPPEYVGVGRGVAEGVDSPPAVGLVALQVLVAPLVTCRQRSLITALLIKINGVLCFVYTGTDFITFTKQQKLKNIKRNLNNNTLLVIEKYTSCRYLNG